MSLFKKVWSNGSTTISNYLIQSSQINNHTQCVGQFPFDGLLPYGVTVTVGSALAVNLRIFFVTEVRMSQQMSGAKVSANCQVGVHSFPDNRPKVQNFQTTDAD